MSACLFATRVAVAVLTAAACLAPTSSAFAADAQSSDASCGRIVTQIQPNATLNLKVGKPGKLAVAFVTERPCVLDVWVGPLGRDTGIVVGPDQAVRFTAPAAVTWTVTGTKKVDDLLVASVRGGGQAFGIRLPDVSVR